MTSRADIAQVPFGDSLYKQVWAGTPNDAGGTILLWNQDLNNTVYVGFRNSIAIGGLNTIPIPPNGMVTLGTDRTIYAIAANGTANLVSIPGGGSFFRGLTQASGQLVLPAITSPNFLAGVSGWAIRKDGSAEFNNLTIRGTFNGSNFILNSSGLFFYNGTPAFGNLIESNANTNGFDSFGNAYLQGSAAYSNPGLNSFYAVLNNQAFTAFYFSSSAAGPWTLLSAVRGDITNGLILLQQQGDGNNYNAGKKRFLASGQSVSSTSDAPITGITGISVAAGKYAVSGVIFATQGGGAFNNNIGFSGPAITSCAIGFSVLEGTTIFNTGVLTALGVFGTGVIPVLTVFQSYFEGTITFSAAGATFGMRVNQGTAGHLWNVNVNSFLDLEPIS